MEEIPSERAAPAPRGVPVLVTARHPVSGRVVMVLAQRLGRWARLHQETKLLSAEDSQIHLQRAGVHSRQP